MLYETYVASLAKKVMPDVGSQSVALMPEIRSVAPYVSGMVARGQFKVTAQEEYTWYARDLKPRLTQINNGGGAYTNATTALVVDDSTVVPVRGVIECRATGERLLCISKDDGTNTITVRRGVGAGGGGGAAAHADSVADDAVLEVIGVASADGADKAPEQWLPDSERNNICQIFRGTVDESGRKKATKLLVSDDDFAALLELQTKRLYTLMEMAFLFGVYSKTVTDANGQRVTLTRGMATDANVVAVNGNITNALWKGHMRNVFSGGGSDERVAFFGLESMDYVLNLFEAQKWRNASDMAVGSVVQTINYQNGILHLVPHKGFKGSRAKDLLLADMVGAQHFIRHMGDGRFNDNKGNKLDGKIQVLMDRQGPSEDRSTAEVACDVGAHPGEKTFNWYFKNISGNA